MELPYKIYDFIPSSIRDTDKDTELLKRFLQGPQEVWSQTYGKIYSILTLIDRNDIPAELLPYKLPQLGFTGEYTALFEGKSANDMRRLLFAAMPLWKERGTQIGADDVLSVFTGRSVKLVQSVFNIPITEETYLTPLDEYRGFWLYEDNYFTEFRIVDEGSLDRGIIRELAKLMRPLSETISIVYLDFADEFNLGVFQWIAKSGDIDIQDGKLVLSDTDFAVVDVLVIR